MKLNPLQLILDADFVVKFVILVLLAASVGCWAIIYQKIQRFRRILKDNEDFMDFFETHNNMEQIYRHAQKSKDNPLANVYTESYAELEKIRDGSSAKQDIMTNIQRLIHRVRQKELAALERRIPFLATTGSAAPFIGLFGTVWGIMNAFLNIGATGATSLAVVAPGIAEALIATAIGLFAAIPAVIGYNYCVSKIRKVGQDLDVVANDFMNMVQRNYL
ncbi:MAG: protein TolQ [Proteobacteria bacterium]|jgi:biopolymer transport protein TolQ|nr:protein TolQ [Pseudomonadota bacterium]